MKNNSILSLIQGLAVLYLVVWSLAPPLSIDNIYRFAALGMAAVWFLIALVRKIQFDSVHIWALMFVVVVAVVAYFENENFSDIIKQILFYILFIEFIIFSFYESKDIWNELRWILPVVLALFIYYNYITTTALLDDPTLARLIVRNDEDTYVYIRQGIGGYGFVYLQVLFFPAALMWTLKAFKSNKLMFVFGTGWIVSYFFLIANAGYSIAIFSTFASMIILFLYKGKSVTGVLIATLVLFIGVMALILYVDQFREWLLVQFDGTAVAKKINDLVATSESGEAEGSIQARVERYIMSLKGLLEYPIIGSFSRPASIGTHSAILDNFVKYGWLGGYIFLKQVFIVPNTYKNKYSSKSIIFLCNAQLVVMIFISLFDTLPYQVMCSFMLIVPIFVYDIRKWTGITNESSLVS